MALSPDVDVPVFPPRTGVNTTSGVRGLGVDEVVVFEVRTGVLPPARVVQAAGDCSPR